ncbi:MAG: hypothetical protein K9H49_15130 [Bacteroidales bacterium]|nr:hypothetical protein [Bacteroidales bacterium]MCF8390771.1 hypothetical protein [Bacteroidales bacterium]
MKKNAIGIIILFVIGTIVSFYLFNPVLKNPNSYLFSLDGDAVKSYFNFSYYLKYDNGLKHDGINYPYGDHLQYINSHPLYVNILKFVDNHLFTLSNYGVGILNLSMIISLVLALPFLFLILRKYALPLWYSIVVSVIILYLSPQFDRIHGHFEMVYAFFIPMFWYFLIRYKENRNPGLWAGLLIVSGLVGGFTSAYYAALYTILILAVILVEIWNKRKNLKAYRWTAFYLFLIALAPLLIVKGLVTITDWVDDRPDNPWGFFIFHSNIFSIFLPNYSPLKSILGDPSFMNFQWEGRSYVGLPATILAISIVLTGVYTLFTREKFNWSTFFPNKKLNVFLMASVIVLLFSMCFPFKYGFAFLKDWIPQIKQFRALGRFSWIFYYTFTIFTAHLVYLHFKRLKRSRKKTAAFILMVFFIGYWSIDAGVNIKRSTRGLLNTNNLLESSSAEYLKMLTDAEINPANYQAIFFLPYANTCGDKLLFTKGMNAFSQAMKCSNHTGLPIIHSFSPRLSFSHALSSIQMLGDPAIEKTRLKDMNEKPLLIIRTNEALTSQEEWMFNNAKPLLKYDNVSVAEFDINTYNESFKAWRTEAISKIRNMTGLEKVRSDTLLDMIIHKDFDKLTDSYAIFNGSGAFYQKKENHILLSSDEFNALPEGDYEVSLWLFVDTRTDNMPELIFYKHDKDGNQIERNKWNNREEHNIYGNWVRIDETIHLTDSFVYRLEVNGKYISVDEILVQPENSNVFIENKQGVSLFNNFPIDF